jgi:hypothetical protein
MLLSNYNRVNVSIRSLSIVLLFLFCFLLSNADIADADVYVSGNFFYASGVIVIGGVGIYFIFSSGNRGHYSKKVKPPENNLIASAYDADLNIENTYSDFDDPLHEGLLKIYTW